MTLPASIALPTYELDENGKARPVTFDGFTRLRPVITFDLVANPDAVAAVCGYKHERAHRVKIAETGDVAYLYLPASLQLTDDDLRAMADAMTPEVKLTVRYGGWEEDDLRGAARAWAQSEANRTKRPCEFHEDLTGKFLERVYPKPR